MVTPLVSIITVNYSTPQLTYDCLDSLAAHLGVPYEVIVVDNGAKAPLDPERLKQWPQVRYLPLTENRGFGAGNNAGAALATGKYVWLLNNDTLLPDSSMDAVFAFLDAHPEIGGLTPLLYNDLGLTQLQLDLQARFQTLGTLVARNARHPLDLSAEWQSVEVAVAASFIMPRALYAQIGGFDESFFMYMEDDDLCYRIRQAGKQVGVYTQARIIHLQGKSSVPAERKKMYYRSQDHFWKKHYGTGAALMMKALRAPYLLIGH